MSLEPPTWPFAIDGDAGRARAATCSTRTCARCHGTYGDGGELSEPGHRASTRSAPTARSANGAAQFADRFVDWFNESFYGETVAPRAAARLRRAAARRHLGDRAVPPQRLGADARGAARLARRARRYWTRVVDVSTTTTTTRSAGSYRRARPRPGRRAARHPRGVRIYDTTEPRLRQRRPHVRRRAVGRRSRRGDRVPEDAVRILLSRRSFLRATGAAGAVLLLPVGCQGPPAPETVLSLGERQMLAALADAVLPPDHQPGGSALGTVDYVEQLLGALDGPVPVVFAGGPYSGRQPFGDGLGGASARFPDNQFAVPAQLDRVSEATWRLRLFGGGGPNEAVLGPVVGLRDQVRAILAEAERYAPAPPEELDADAAGRAPGRPRPDVDRLPGRPGVRGGVRRARVRRQPGRRGLGAVPLRGRQPAARLQPASTVGTGAYRERAPMSTPDPGADPDADRRRHHAICVARSSRVPRREEFA